MVSLFEAVILSVIQGITEWFPISSSGHLALMQEIFGFQNLAFLVFLHFSSILAIIVVFRKDIIKLLNLKEKENLKYIRNLIIALIPAGIIGLVFKDSIESLFSNVVFLGFFFIFSGIFIYSTKFAKGKKEKIGLLDSIFIGIFQAIAILPGISRSGFTISSGLFRGLKKQTAITFSFLLAIPLIFGAFILEIKDLAASDISLNIFLISFIICFLVSLFVIKLLIRIIKQNKFYLFGYYNIIMGILILVWYLVF